ncbi:MAG: mechanosensitive ion channel family protein [Gammaproteobacteria bacterium]|nr:mechanosensitive ion channel family protein [Gammaproteobacteria bacterium]
MYVPEGVVATARDPLVITLFIFSLGGLLTHLMFRRHPLGRASVRVISLIVLTIVLLYAEVIPYQPLTRTGVPFKDAVYAALKIAWWLWTAWFLVSLMRVFVLAEHGAREGRLVQDLLAGLIYLAAGFAIIAYVFDLPIRGLVATSGAIAIVLGLALQSTLKDVFSGIVLSFSRPYRPGDWISIDGTTEGRVIEMRWRATHVLTEKRDLAIVPNSTITKAQIVNASSPSGIHGMTVSIQLGAKISPTRTAEILRHAVLTTRLILTFPAPSVGIKSITTDAIKCDISFFVEALDQSARAQNELFDWIYRHLAVAGIDDGAAITKDVKTDAARAFDLIAIFADLTAEERDTLAAKTKREHYDEGEVLVNPGTVLRSLFVIGAGVASQTVATSEGEVESLRLGPGDHFGEMGMLAGQPTEATLKALVPVTIYELAKEDLDSILQARPEISGELGRALARRQAAGQLTTSPNVDKTMPPGHLAAWFSERLQRLFEVVNAE